MEELFLSNPELAKELIFYIISGLFALLGFSFAFILILAKIIGYFVKKQFTDIKLTFVGIEDSIKELNKELRMLTLKVLKIENKD